MDNDVIDFRTEVRESLKELRTDLKEIRVKQDKHAWYIGLGMGMMILTGWYVGLNDGVTWTAKHEQQVVSDIRQSEILVSKK